VANHTSKYVFIIGLTLVCAALSTWSASKSPAVRFSASLSDLPKKIGTWEGVDSEIDEATRKALGADATLARQYYDTKTGRTLGLLIVYRKYGRRDFAHRPELCYPASGWEIVRKDYTDLPYAGTQMPARLVIAEKSIDRDVIVYWFASGKRTEASYVKQQIKMALDRLQQQKYGWAFIRINTPSEGSDDEALARVRTFLRDAGKPLMETLTGSSGS
jgi:EpsI family protein